MDSRPILCGILERTCDSNIWQSYMGSHYYDGLRDTLPGIEE